MQQVAEGVRVNTSECIETNTVIVDGPDGVLLVDPGLTNAEYEAIAVELRDSGQAIAAGFATHPDWDHANWHPTLGDAPRYGTAAAADFLREFLANDGWQEQFAEGLPPEIAGEVPVELFGLIQALPAGTERFPWGGPGIRVIEHRAHAVGHAALFVEQPRVLVAGDMLSDILVPFLDVEGADDPAGDYLAALDRFEQLGEVAVVIPGHGSPGGAAAFRERLALDRAYVRALVAGDDPADPRVGPDAPLDWMADVHAWQLERFRERFPA